jgi:hypothetical protein
MHLLKKFSIYVLLILGIFTSSHLAYSQDIHQDLDSVEQLEALYFKKLLEIGKVKLYKDNGDVFFLKFKAHSDNKKILLAHMIGEDNYLGTKTKVDVDNMTVFLTSLETNFNKRIWRISIKGDNYYLYTGFFNFDLSFFYGDKEVAGQMNFGALSLPIYAKYLP